MRLGDVLKIQTPNAGYQEDQPDADNAQDV